MINCTFSAPRQRFFAIAVACAAAFLAGCGKSSPPDHNSEPRRYIYEYGQKVRFGYGGDSFRFRLTGWSHIEPKYTWSEGVGASLAFRVPASNGPVTLRMRLAAFTKLPELPFQPVHVYVNGQQLGTWEVSSEKNFSLVIPKEFVAAPANEHEGGGTGETPLGFTNAGKTRLLIIDLHTPKAASPFDLDVNWDIRRLGIRCTDVTITQSAEQAAADAAAAKADAAEAALALANQRDSNDDAPQGAREQSYALGTVIDFGAAGNADRYKQSGWYTAEEGFSWTGKAPGVIALAVPKTDVPLDLRAKLGGMIKPGRLPVQPTDVYANGEKIAEWQVGTPAEFHAVIPNEVIGKDGRLEIEFRALKPVAPKAIDAGGDVRILGLRCESVVITPQREPPPTPTPSPTPTPRQSAQ